MWNFELEGRLLVISKTCVKCGKIKWWYKFYHKTTKSCFLSLDSHCVECRKKVSKVSDSVKLENKAKWDEKLQINQLSETDAAYIAGLIDGEGCVCLHASHTKDSTRTTTHNLRVRLTNTFPGIVEWVGVTVGYGNVHTKKKYPSANKESWEWMINGRRAINLLHQLYPYLKIKRLQAEIAFKFAETLSPPGQNRVSKNVIDIRNILRKQMSTLNN